MTEYSGITIGGGSSEVPVELIIQALQTLLPLAIEGVNALKSGKNTISITPEELSTKLNALILRPADEVIAEADKEAGK
jgi:hypothetical protein